MAGARQEANDCLQVGVVIESGMVFLGQGLSRCDCRDSAEWAALKVHLGMATGRGRFWCDGPCKIAGDAGVCLAHLENIRP